MRFLGLIVMLSAFGCERPLFNCELDVDGVSVCVDMTSRSFCEVELAGSALKITDGQNQTCKLNGYVEACEDMIDVQGEGHWCSAATLEDCEAAAESAPWDRAE